MFSVYLLMVQTNSGARSGVKQFMWRGLLTKL